MIVTKFAMVYLGKPSKEKDLTLSFDKPKLNIAGWRDTYELAKAFADEYPVNFHSIVEVKMNLDDKADQ